LFYGGGVTLLMAQLKGIVAVAVYACGVAGLLARGEGSDGSPRQQGREINGLDLGEHGEEAYIILRRACRRREQKSPDSVLKLTGGAVAPPVPTRRTT
jgi:hypothetical protein